MSRSQILAHERANGRPMRLADDSSILLDNPGWPNVKVERQVLPTTMMVDRYLPEHLIAVLLRPPKVLALRSDSGTWREWRPGPGEVHVVPAWTVSSPSWDEEIEALHVALDPAYVERLAEEAFGTDQVRFTEERLGDDPQLRHLALALAAEAAAPGGGDPLTVETLTTALAGRLLCGYTQRAAPDEPRGSMHPRRASAMVARVRERVEDSLDQPLRIADLAAGEHLSTFHFAHAFKAAAGVSPYRFVVERRVERAKGLLLATDLSVGEIAKRCGFTSSAQLARAFRRLLGVSPTQFRHGR